MDLSSPNNALEFDFSQLPRYDTRVHQGVVLVPGAQKPNFGTQSDNLNSAVNITSTSSPSIRLNNSPLPCFSPLSREGIFRVPSSTGSTGTQLDYSRFYGIVISCRALNALSYGIGTFPHSLRFILEAVLCIPSGGQSRLSSSCLSSSCLSFPPPTMPHSLPTFTKKKKKEKKNKAS